MLIIPEDKSSRSIQLPSPSLQVGLKKLGCLRGRVHAEATKHVRPVRKVGGQRR